MKVDGVTDISEMCSDADRFEMRLCAQCCNTCFYVVSTCCYEDSVVLHSTGKLDTHMPFLWCKFWCFAQLSALALAAHGRASTANSTEQVQNVAVEGQCMINAAKE